MFQYDFSEIQAQLETLPTLMRAWFGWIGVVVLVSPLLFLRQRQGRVAALFALLFLPLLVVTLHTVGISYFISFLHLVLWLPLLGYLAGELRDNRITPFSTMGFWSMTMLATLTVSLVFDLRDAVRWLAGERGIIAPEPGIYLPWITIPGMIAAFVGVGAYVTAGLRRVRHGVRER